MINISEKTNNILVLAAHTDDEIACAGLLCKLSKLNNAKIKIIAFSYPHDKQEIYDEFVKSCNIINANYLVYDYRLRYLNQYRQDILEILYKEYKVGNYDLVLCPNSNDFHQDHKTINEETIRAFRNTNILGYEMVRNYRQSLINCFCPLTEENLKLKIDIAGCYVSQSFRNAETPEIITSLARIRGLQCNTQYAEGYEAINVII